MDEIQAGTFTFRERLYHWFFVILLLVSYSSGQVVPDPPKNVSLVTKGSRTIEISWMAGFNGSSAIQNYTVEIGEDKENFTGVGCQGTLSNGTCVVSNSTNASLTGLFPFTKYFIRVFATNAIGRSNSSSVVIVTTDEEEPSAAPSNVRGHNTSSTSILVEWDDVPAYDQNGIIMSYNITYQSLTENHSNSTTVDYPVRQVTLLDLKEFVIYSITVFASTKIGDGPASDPVYVKTDEDKPTAAPVNVTGHKTSSTGILVEWDDVPDFDQNGIITSYNITYRSKTEYHNGFAEAGPSDRQKEVKDLREYVEYDITVRASTSKGDGPDSSPITVRTDQDEPSSSPQGVQASAKNSTSVSVSWAAVGNEQRNGIIKGYKVIYQALPDGRNVTRFVNISDEDQGKEQDITLGDLVKFTNYSIRVLAFTVVGDGPPSEVKIVQTQQDKPTAAPANVVGQSLSSKSILVTWNEVPPADQNGIIMSYNVTYQSLTENYSNSTTVDYPAGRVTLSDLKEFVIYSITVFASTKIGDGPASDPVYVKTDEDKPTAAPVNVRGHNTSSTSILVEWDDVPDFDQNGIITSYNITYRSKTENHNGFAEAGPNDRQKEVTDLREYVEYDITVRASTSKGDGPDSSPITVRTDQDEPTAAPSNVRGHNTSSTSILVEWDNVTAYDQNGIITSYNITYQSLTENHSNSTTVNYPVGRVTLSDLKEFVNYSITVFASTKIGDGPASDPVYVKTDEDKPTAAPLNVRGHNTSSTSILVEWDDVPAYDQNGIITSYNITYRSQTEEHNGFAIAGPNDLQKNLTNLREYVDYEITVLASTFKGDGPDSSLAIVVRTDQDKPTAPPANIRGHNTSSTSILVEWREVPPADQNGVILTYTISYQSLTQNDNSSKTVGSSIQKLNLTGLKEFVDYNITLFASTVKGNGKLSDPIFVITDQDKPTAAPVSVRGHKTSSTSILVEWDDVPAYDQNGIITSYNITYRSQTEEHKGFAIAGPNDLQKNLTDLREYVDYNITVRASTSKGDGPDSNPAIVVRTDQDRPSAAPQNLRSINTTSTSIFVMWDKVLPDEQNGIIISYNVSYRAIPEAGSAGPLFSKLVMAPTRHVNLTDLTRDMHYNVSVLASTIKGDGKYSNPKKLRTNEDRPGDPQNVQGYNTSSTSIRVTWKEVPEDKQHGDIISYTVMYKRTTNVTYKSVEVTPISGKFAELNGLDEYTFYDIKVLAATNVGNGPASNPIKVQTDEDRPSAAPQNLRSINTTSTSIFVSWDEVLPDEQNGIIISYKVSYRAIPEAGSAGPFYFTKVMAPSRQVNLTSLTKDMHYNVSVLASTTKGDGNYSDPKTLRTNEDSKSFFFNYANF
nr:protein sidekick-1-like [Pocillopora verrucosa]